MIGGGDYSRLFNELIEDKTLTITLPEPSKIKSDQRKTITDKLKKDIKVLNDEKDKHDVNQKQLNLSLIDIINEFDSLKSKKDPNNEEVLKLEKLKDTIKKQKQKIIELNELVWLIDQNITSLKGLNKLF